MDARYLLKVQSIRQADKAGEYSAYRVLNAIENHRLPFWSGLSASSLPFLLLFAPGGGGP
jgi:hypothetical protein